MKNIERKHLLAASILAGLLFAAACNDPLRSNSAARSALTETKDFSEEETGFTSDYEWLSVFNRDGTMENIRVPVIEDGEAETDEETDQEPEIVVMTGRVENGIWGFDSVILDGGSVMRGN